jgi:excisionase family DNA binding protein
MERQEWMTLEDVKAYLLCSHTTIYKLIKKGELPQQRKIGGMSRWSRQEIDTHIFKDTQAAIKKYVTEKK